MGSLYGKEEYIIALSIAALGTCLLVDVVSQLD